MRHFTCDRIACLWAKAQRCYRSGAQAPGRKTGSEWRLAEAVCYGQHQERTGPARRSRAFIHALGRRELEELRPREERRLHRKLSAVWLAAIDQLAACHADRAEREVRGAAVRAEYLVPRDSH